MNIHMAKKWPEMVVERSFIKGHSFRNSLYHSSIYSPLNYTNIFLGSSSDESSSSASTSDSDHIIGARGKNKFIKGKAFKIG